MRVTEIAYCKVYAESFKAPSPNGVKVSSMNVNVEGEREALLAAINKLVDQAQEQLKPEPVIGLGDVVSLGGLVDEGYNTATVSQVYDDGTVDLFRPYVHTADFFLHWWSYLLCGDR